MMGVVVYRYMVKKDVIKTKKGSGGDVVADKRRGGGDVSKKSKKKVVSKGDLVGQIRKCKQEMQEVRFGLSKEVQQKGGSRRNLRKQVARAATQLTMLRKNGAVS